MDPLLALLIISWIAIVVLYLGLAAVLREVRMLRRQVSELGLGLDDTPTDDVVRMPPHVAPGRSLVLASDSTCPLCRLLLATLARVQGRIAVPVTVLGYQDPQEWQDFPAGMRYVRDDEAWRQIAHLSPPVLMLITEDGTAQEVTMPSSEAEMTGLLHLWGVADLDEARGSR